MRRALLSTAVLIALLDFGRPAPAQRYEPAVPPGEVYGVGCHWFRGHHYCNRYCYLEIDGYYYCQPRLRDAGSQAAKPVFVVPPPNRYTPPSPPHASRRSVRPPAGGRKAPRR